MPSTSPIPRAFQGAGNARTAPRKMIIVSTPLQPFLMLTEKRELVITVPFMLTSWPNRFKVTPLAFATPAVKGSTACSLTGFHDSSVKPPRRMLRKIARKRISWR